MKKKHTNLGIISGILSIIAFIGWIFIPIFLSGMNIEVARNFVLISFVGILLLGVIAIIIGAIAYLGRRKDDFGIGAIILGILSLPLNILMFLGYIYSLVY